MSSSTERVGAQKRSSQQPRHLRGNWPYQNCGDSEGLVCQSLWDINIQAGGVHCQSVVGVPDSNLMENTKQGKINNYYRINNVPLSFASLVCILWCYMFKFISQDINPDGVFYNANTITCVVFLDFVVSIHTVAQCTVYLCRCDSSHRSQMTLAAICSVMKLVPFTSKATNWEQDGMDNNEMPSWSTTLFLCHFPFAHTFLKLHNRTFTPVLRRQ